MASHQSIGHYCIRLSVELIASLIFFPFKFSIHNVFNVPLSSLYPLYSCTSFHFFHLLHFQVPSLSKDPFV